MILIFLPVFVSSLTYQFLSGQLTISGSGSVTQQGVRSQGDYTEIINTIIGEGATGIGQLSFYQCIRLMSISIPSTVTKIDASSFNRCSALERIVVSSENKIYSSDSQNALYNYEKTHLIHAPTIQNFIIPETVQSIESSCFRTERVYNMGDIVLPNSLQTISSNCFGESAFGKITFKESPQITEIPIQSFSFMKAELVMIPKSCIVIRSSAFISSTINEIVFQNDSELTEIGENAFLSLNCNTNITLPDSLLTISSNAFQQSKFPSIFIGKSCNNISLSAFSMCSSLKKIEVAEENQFYTSSEDGVVMNKNKTTLLFLPTGNNEITIQKSITSIGETLLQSQPLLTNIILESKDIWETESGVLYSNDFKTLVAVCGGITSVIAHKSVTSIGPKAASECSNLKSFQFQSDTCETISEYSFAFAGIESISIPSTLTSIQEYAFYNCKSLVSITIPKDSKLTSIGEEAFRYSSISSIFIPEKVSSLQAETFSFISNTFIIEFHENSVISSLGLYCFSNSGIETIKLPNTVKTIGSSCFRNCESLKSISFGSGLESISDQAFSNCVSLISIELPASCTTVSSYSFAGCSNLSNFLHSLPVISANVFENCVSLVSFHIPSQTVEINPSAFDGCSSLIRFTVDDSNHYFKAISDFLFDSTGKIFAICPPGRLNVIVPDTLSSIAALAFSVASQLRFVSFLKCSEIVRFEESLFSKCPSLQEIQFPPLLQTIGTTCFSGCSKLKTIVLPPLLKKIESNAFSSCSSLKMVCYCGINSLTECSGVFNGCNIGHIYVSSLYEGDTFCSLPVLPKLSTNCMLPCEKTCDHGNVYFIHPRILFFVIFHFE